MAITRDQARKELERRGISIAEFSRSHDLNPNLVSDLLAGRKKGLRGEAHRAAVLLGIKDGVIYDVADFPPSAPSELPIPFLTCCIRTSAMYQDPKRVRSRYGAINLDQYEARLIDALVDYTGLDKAALLRQLVLKEALETLGVADLDTRTLQPRAS